MKKYMFLVSVFVLAACGGGHSGGGYQSNESVVAVDIPQQRISADVAENRGITGMASSVNNSGEMASAVENAVGSDLLSDISKNLNTMADSIRHYSNRELSDRRNSSSAQLPSISADNSKTQTAYAFLEYGRRFRNFDKNNQQKFIQEHPELRSFIFGWGKLFCGCNVNGYSDEQLLNLFDNVANQNRFDNFYKNHHYKEFLLDNVRFNVSGFNNGEPEDDEIKFVVDNKNGVITGLAWVDDNGDVVETMNRNKNANGKYNDTFKTTGYKYLIPVAGWSQPYVTDSFSNMDISTSDLRDIIENALNHDDGCNDGCKSSILAAFDDGQGRWVEQISDISYDLKGNSLGLRYSDFGYMTMVAKKFDGETIPEADQEPDHMVIVGGFASKQIDPTLFANETMDFRGTAIGAVAYYLGGDDEESKRITTDANAATLHFENGNETLIMPFNDYYTVTVNKDQNGATVAFSDYPDGEDVKFKFAKESNVSTANGDLVNVNIKYYGDSYVPSEVVGGVTYEEHSAGNLKSFESAFGMTKR